MLQNEGHSFPNENVELSIVFNLLPNAGYSLPNDAKTILIGDIALLNEGHLLPNTDVIIPNESEKKANVPVVCNNIGEYD